MINLHSISFLNHGNTWLYGSFCVVFDCFTWNKNSLKQLQSLNKMCFSFEVCFGDSHWKLWLALWVLHFLFSDLSFMDLEKNSEIGTGVQKTLQKIRMHWKPYQKKRQPLYLSTQGILANSLLAYMFSPLFLSVGFTASIACPIGDILGKLTWLWNQGLLLKFTVKRKDKLTNNTYKRKPFISEDLKTLGRLRTYPLWKQ